MAIVSNCVLGLSWLASSLYSISSQNLHGLLPDHVCRWCYLWGPTLFIQATHTYTLHSVLFYFTTGLIFEHFLEEKCNLEKISGFIFFFGKIINELCVVTLLRIISGARYSGVPHNVQVLPLTRLANPKSVICKWNGINNSESF